MKRLLLLIVICTITISATISQVFDSLTVISPDHTIQDITSKGNQLFAAMGEGGVMYSSDEGFTWNETSPFPDAGFGQEAANSILAASNGDLIVGGNLNYNGSAFSSVVFRSSNNGTSWSFVAVEGLGGYEKSGKIIELPNGGLMMKGGQNKLFVSSLTNPEWAQCVAPGGVIFGFDHIDEMIFTVTNPSAGTAGTWVSSDLGTSWELYGGNGTPVSGGTVTMAPIIRTDNYKFVCIGGSYDLKGVFRSGINDTLWMEKNNGIDNFGIYPICMATDNNTIWMVFQDAGGGCYFTSTSDFAENWEEPVMGMPQQGVGGPCLKKMIVFNTHLYTYANNSIYRIENVAGPSSIKGNYAESKVDIYPNPVNDQLNLKFRIPGINQGHWEILNLYGQKLKLGKLNFNSQNTLSIDVESLPRGYYLLMTEVDSKKSVNSFIKN